MSNVAINVNSLSKRYRIGRVQNYKTLRESLTNAVTHNLSKLKRVFSRSASPQNGAYNHIWSLKDVSFDVAHGEILGIIGRNGAGKSTLLKIITGITDPTEGNVSIYGRIGSLLEVGTGFHEELTGRENIYLNGAILGMKRHEIDRKFDEIIDFSEVGEFLDTPVKFYSSGMRVRLGFSVAAHLEPEILLIDEVLAVGDASFQKKCLGKLNNVATTEGRTVLFVSHDMASILSLCGRTMLIEDGNVIADGKSDEVVQQYLQTMSETMEIPLDQRTDREGDWSVLVNSVKVENAQENTPIRCSSKLKLTIGYKSDKPVRYCNFTITVRDFKTGAAIITLDSDMTHTLPESLPSEGKVVCTTDSTYLTPGRCILDITIKRGAVTTDKIRHASYFDVETENIYDTGKVPNRNQALYLLKHKWYLD